MKTLVAHRRHGKATVLRVLPDGRLRLRLAGGRVQDVDGERWRPAKRKMQVLANHE